jgi:phage recombination protein Bet
MSSAIQQVQQVGLALSEWPAEVWEVVKQQVCPKGITDPEFVVFAAQCKARGLNPLAGEAYCVPRRTNVGNRDNPKWVTNHVFQPSAEGMQARAARFPDFGKVDSGAVYERDPVVKVDAGRGQVEHVFDPTKPRGMFKGSWGRVVKRDGTTVVVWLDAGDRTGSGQFWEKSMARMHEKCARVAALRQAYPVAFAGVYAREEMEDATTPEPSRAEQVTARADGEATLVSAAPELSLPGPVVEFGEKWKGRPIEALTLEECEEALMFAEAKVHESPKAKWVAKMQANAALVEAHRDALKAQGAPREELDTTPGRETVLVENEPGSEG